VTTIRVAPDEANPTHHFSLTNRAGVSVGLKAVTRTQEGYKVLPFRDLNIYRKIPVTTTAFKQTSGSSGYDIFDYPYSPIVQDTTEGGRGNLDFERDSTKFYDSYRAATGRQNKAYAGPLEKYAEGVHRAALQSLPGSVDWVQMTGETRYIYRRFQATGMTTSKVWLKLRRKNKPEDLTIKLYSDNSGVIDSELTSLSVPYTWTDDMLGEWMNDTLAQALSNGVYYWLVVYSGSGDNARRHWKVAVKEDADTTYAGSVFSSSPTIASFDLYFRLTDADSEKTCIPFDYKGQKYFVVSGTSGAPKIYMAGDRGAADSNTGNLSKLIDATKSWETDAHVGDVVLITDGPGKLEAQPWRTVTANVSGELTVDSPFTIDHTTSTEYVLLSPVLKELSGHGLTAPVTDVLVSTTGVVYFCMGDTVTVRRLRAYNDAGTWRDFDDAANCQADETSTTKAVFMIYKPQAQRIVIANNYDASGNVSVNINNAAPPAWGTALVFGAAKNVDSKYNSINSLIVHPDTGGNEVLWVMKTDMPYIVSGTTTLNDPYPAGSPEMASVNSLANGVNPLRHDVYLYFPLLQGLEKYYGGTYTDMGPNLGEGLPENRRGNIVDMVGYPGKFFAVIDAGTTGYSSVMDSGGWHERYRAPKGQRIKAASFQVIPGTGVDRLWLWQGNDLVYLPFPSNSTNELEDSGYEYVDEWAVQFSRMHAGMYDVQKMIRFLKIQSDRLEKDSDGRAVCWIEIDFKKDGATEWESFDDVIANSPTYTMDFGTKKYYGLAGKQLNFRIRGYSRDKNKTPVFLALIIFAVQRVDIKAQYGPFMFLCEDDEVIGLRELDTNVDAKEKLKLLEDFGDATNDSLLLLRACGSLCDDRMVFLNVGDREQVRFASVDNTERISDAFLVQVTFQDA